ncbi:MAG: hypothetical protein WBH47_07060 [Streptosporangiaceae bacterium]
MLGIDRRSAAPVSPLRDLLDAAGVTLSVGLIGLVIEGAVGLPRILLALAFAFFVPGRAIMANWPRFAYWSEFGMSIVLSLAVLTLLATLALWAHRWHPVGMFEIEALLSVVALVVSMIRRHQGRDTGQHRQRPHRVAADAEMREVEAPYDGGARPAPRGEAW